MSTNSKFLTLCIKCNHYPNLSFNKENIKEVLIQCDYCGYNQYYSINDYLKQKKSKYIKEQVQVNNCNEHDIESTIYCIQCKKYICNKCMNHQSHNCFKLEQKIQISTLNDQIKDGFNHINNYCRELKFMLIKVYFTKINQIEHSYQSFRMINNDILNLYQCIVDNYSNKDYNLTRNVMNINHINLYKWKSDTVNESLIDYFNNYSLLQDSIADVLNVKEIKTIKEHNESVNSLLLLQDGRLASCSTDKTINIYNLNNNYHCDIRIKTGHTNGVTYICELEKNKIASCSLDKSIKIWSISKSTYQCEHTYQEAHSNYIWKVILMPNNRIASCSKDKTIKIWKCQYPYTMIKELEGHSQSVKTLIQLKEKDKLLSASNIDFSLIIWDSSSYNCDKVINNINCCDINSLYEIDNHRVIVGGFQMITIINVDSYKVEEKYLNEQLDYVYSLMMLRDGNILCGCVQGKIYKYNIKLNTITVSENTSHNSHIFDLVSVNKHQFISCSYDKTIKIWEY